jgi:hypothetical protein
MKPEEMHSTPPGSIYVCHLFGWIQTYIFTEWFHHFISSVKPTAEDPVVLVLHGHYSHIRNIDAIDTGRQNHVAIVCLPPPQLPQDAAARCSIYILSCGS